MTRASFLQQRWDDLRETYGEVSVKEALAMELDDESWRRKESAMRTMLSIMDVPPRRVEQGDWRWCLRNLAVHNRNHAMYETAMDMLRFLVRHERSEG